MLFQQLTLTNFRVFAGTTNIDLAPKKDGLFERPIVLFGGLNGAGKTSILTAIRIALLGRRAVGQVISKKDFQQFLEDQINKTVLADDQQSQATISLSFTHTHQGSHKRYSVTRTWAIDQDEQVSLEIDGKIDKTLNNDQVQAFLHELVPPGIGDLFFFDGEKIAELAEDDTGAYLKEAVQRLLGLDIISRLQTDLDIYLKETGKSAADKDTLKKIDAAEAEKSTIEKESQIAFAKVDEIATKLAEVRAKVAEKEQELTHNDQSWTENKTQQSAKKDSLVELKTQLQADIRAALSGNVPMAYAPNAMKALIKQLEHDQQIKKAHAFGEELQASLPELEDKIKTNFADASPQIVQTIHSYFGGLINQTAMQKPVFDIADTDLAAIKAQFDDALTELARVNVFEKTLAQTEQALESLAIDIERAPEEDLLKTRFKQLRQLEQEAQQVSKQYINQLLAAKALKAKELELAKRLEKLYATLKNKHSEDKAVTRVSKSQLLLEEFKQQLTALRVVQLENLFVTAYRKLARKEDLKLSAKIDPTTFDVVLLDKQGVAINRKSMSAGEKQIFAFAILEALGKLSGKVLPVVVDTPLGRLDSKHREKLVTHYFPEASEQVILLSTDTEVDGHFYEALAPNVSHAFEIDFNQQTRCSSLKPGYFWANIKEAV
ncbi:DNA sulfur modification protein DndD [Pseudoalteromonas xiamenensis]|uniref:DNA sulfur modification protein DndD n=1 Tax=Pseudoalteromonas xiamenensis TaxID=882626 RepID=UPI0035E84E87